MRLTRLRPATTAGLELSVTSFIDVVFLLLIFFVTTSTFLQSERQLRPSIAVERAGVDASLVDIEPLSIEIVRIGQDAVFRIGATESPDLAVVRPIIEAWPDKSRGAWIRMADDVPFGMSAQAVDACDAAGFEAIALVPLISGRSPQVP